jgi:hypothetical protein
VVSKFEKRLIQAAKEAVAFARGGLAPGTYRVHHARDDDADATVVMRQGERIFHGLATRAGAGVGARSKKAARRPMVARKTKKK